jgi:hypothetical protein
VVGRIVRHRSALIALTLGASVYLLLRPSEAWFVERVGAVPLLGSLLRAIRVFTVPLGEHVPPIFLGVVPDFAWAFALGSVLESAWRGEAGRARMAWWLVGLAATIGYEVGQRWSVIPGTFDPYDLVAQIAGYALGWRAGRRAGGDGDDGRHARVSKKAGKRAP